MSACPKSDGYWVIKLCQLPRTIFFLHIFIIKFRLHWSLWTENIYQIYLSVLRMMQAERSNDLTWYKLVLFLLTFTLNPCCTIHTVCTRASNRPALGAIWKCFWNQHFIFRSSRDRNSRNVMSTEINWILTDWRTRWDFDFARQVLVRRTDKCRIQWEKVTWY